MLFASGALGRKVLLWFGTGSRATPVPISSLFDAPLTAPDPVPRADKQVRAGLCPRTAFLLRTSCNLAAQEEGVGFSNAQVSCFRLWVSGVGGTSQAGSQGSFAACSMLGQFS